MQLILSLIVLYMAFGTLISSVNMFVYLYGHTEQSDQSTKKTLALSLILFFTQVFVWPKTLIALFKKQA